MILTPDDQDFIYFGGGELEDGSVAELIDTSFRSEGRWSIYHAVTFRVDGDSRLWQFIYETPATEMQEGSIDLEDVEAYTVVPVPSVRYERAS
jgi:hypothetical protein